MPISEMLEIEEFDADIVDSLRARAKEVLLTQAIAKGRDVEGAGGESHHYGRHDQGACLLTG